MATITLTRSDEYRHPAATTSLVGEYIREQREQRGMSGRELARRLGMSAVYLNLIERGQRDPDPALWRTIGQAVGCDLDMLKRKYRLEAARRASERWEQA